MPDIHRLFERSDVPNSDHVGVNEIGIFQSGNRHVKYVDHAGTVRTFGSYSGTEGDGLHWGTNDDDEDLHLQLNTHSFEVNTNVDDYPYGYIALLANPNTGYITSETAFMRFNVYESLELYTGGFYVDAAHSGYDNSFVSVSNDTEIGSVNDLRMWAGNQFKLQSENLQELRSVSSSITLRAHNNVNFISDLNDLDFTANNGSLTVHAATSFQEYTGDHQIYVGGQALIDASEITLDGPVTMIGGNVEMKIFPTQTVTIFDHFNNPILKIDEGGQLYLKSGMTISYTL